VTNGKGNKPMESGDARQEGRQLAVQLMLMGITRRRAAEAMCISYSALNKKLAGQAPIYSDEKALIEAFIASRQAGKEAGG
jgi:hypothetical protein